MESNGEKLNWQIYCELVSKAKTVSDAKSVSVEIEKIADEHAIEFVNWLTSEKSEYSVMYGNQEKRFANFDNEYSIVELLEIYKSLNA